QLDGPGRAITTSTTDALNGNLVQTTRVDLQHARGGFTLALGFGPTPAAAALSTKPSLSGRSFRSIEREFDAGWKAHDDGLVDPPKSFRGLRTSQLRQLV